MIEVLILSLIQGVTEFIPISSSSHLILISEFIRFDNQSLSIDVSLHIGSFLAIVFYFKNEIANFFLNKELFFKIFISSTPVLLFGFLLVQTNIIDEIRNKYGATFIKPASLIKKTSGLGINNVQDNEDEIF